MMKLTALDALQSGLENVQRVIDVHGDCEVGGDDEPIYDLEIAADYLREAERLLEADQSSPGRLRRWISTLIDSGTNTTPSGG